MKGGSLVDATILSGGSATIFGSDTGTTIEAGATETVTSSGAVSGDQIYGTQVLVSSATATVTSERYSAVEP